MSVILGALFALGVLLVYWALTTEMPKKRSKRASKLAVMGTRAGLSRTETRVFASTLVVLPLVVFLVVMGLTRAWSVALAVAVAVSTIPPAWLYARQEKHLDVLRKAWPDVVDSLLSAIRAGVTLPEAVVQLAHSGPDATKPYFERFAREYRASGRFEEALEGVQDDLSDPTATRLFEVLKLARQVGGSELGNLLRDLSAVLRDDVRVRGELLARQSWTVNAARLAVAAPWLVLVLISTRIDAASAYSTPAGVMVLLIGGIACMGAYALMKFISRLDGVK